MDAFLVISAIALCSLALNVFWWFEYRSLHNRLKKDEASVESTSKLLIEKNMELFDQSIDKEKQLTSKDDFIAIASHQLRTPVAEIKWSVGAILDKPASDPVREDLEKVKSIALKMERLIEDLLQFAGIEQNHTRTAVAPYDPHALIKASIERTLKDFPGRSVQITSALDWQGTLDSIDTNSLDMILSNLLENAILYTPDGGSVTVRTQQSSGDQFELIVEDTGMGVSPSMLDRLFVKFRRSEEAQARNPEGSGLGLYIIKTILERVGGQIAFQPRTGGGSIFTVQVPRQKKI